LNGFLPLLLIFIGSTPAATTGFFILFGLLNGGSGGIYWANRNTFTSQVTAGPHRYQFISLESTLNTLTTIFLPFFVGWAIVLGERFDLYSTTSAYRVFALCGFVLLAYAGILTREITHEKQSHIPLR